MKKLNFSACRLVSLSAIMLSLVASIAHADILDELRAKQSKIISVSATFAQEKNTRLLSRPIRTSGRFLYKQPDKIRWEYAGNANMQVIFNGKDLWLYYPALKEADKLGGVSQYSSMLHFAESATAKPVAEADPPEAPDLPLPAAEKITLGAARAAHAAQEGQPTPVARIESALGSRQWTEDVGQRIVWSAGRGESRAELVLHPPHLGRVEVAITVSSNGDSTALFVSANPQVRDALEQSLPRLREIMAEAGIALGQASVQSDSAPRDDREQQNGPAPGGRLRAGVADLPLAEPGPACQGNRMVDIFA